MATKSKVLIRMKSKPKRPVRKTERVSRYVRPNENLDNIARFFMERNIHLSDVVWTGYGSKFEATVPESDVSFDARMATYEQKMQAYHNWHEENKKLIEDELNRRKYIQEQKNKKEEEKILKQLEQQLERQKATAAKRLARIEKQLASVQKK